MKKKNLWIGLLAITLVFGMTIAACGGDDDDDGGDRVSVPSQLVGEWNSSDGRDSITFKSNGEINSLRYKLFFFILSSSTLGSTSGTIVFGYQSELIGPSGRFSYSISGNTMTISNSDHYDFPNGTYTRGSGGTNDNMTWTAVANSTFGTSQINTIAFGNGTFVAGGEDGKMAYSSNGITWTTVADSKFGSNTIEAIAYGNGKFVAVGSDGKITYSSNGTSWTEATTNIPYSPHLEAIAYGNNMFVAGGQYGTMATSTDGVTWIYVDISNITGNIGEIAFGNGTFVASDRYSSKIVWSTNSTTWTAVDVKSIFSPNDDYGSYIGAIAYGNNKFILIGNDDDYEDVLLTSPDGKTWTPVKVDSDNFIFDCEAIVYVNNKFVAVGNLGWMMTSTNGTSWTLAKDVNIQYKIYALAYGNGKFVAGGKNGKISYSSDGSGSGGGNPQTATYTGTSGSTAYTLKITENTARYTAQNGDAYELTAGAKKSTGTVNNVSGGVLTLKPSNAVATFTATVSGSSLTALNGTITWTDKTTAAAPGTFTTGSNPGTGGNGTLTVTDIPSKYNGKYAYFMGIVDPMEGIAVSSYQHTTGTEALNTTYTRISNGKVSMPTWLINTNDNTSVRYSGNDTVNGIGFYICEHATLKENSAKITNTVVVGTFMSVTFSNGSVTKSKNDAYSWTEDPYK